MGACVAVGGMSAVRLGCWIVLWCLCCTCARAGTPALTVYNSDEYTLVDYLDFYEDTTGTLTFEDMRKPENEQKFKKLENRLFTWGITNSGLWFRLKIKYPAGAPNVEESKRWVYEVARTLLNEAECYVVRSDGKIKKITSDVRTPFKNHPISHAYSAFPVTLKLGEEATFYVRIKNNTSTFVPQTLYSENGFAKKTSIESFLFGIFYGGIILISIYNLFIFLSTRDASYLFYVGYLMFVMFFVLLDLGVGLTFIDKGDEGFDKRIVVWSLYVSLFAGAIFMDRFLEMKKYHPVFHHLMIIAVCLIPIVIFVSRSYDFFETVKFSGIFASTLGTVIFYMACYCWYSGNPHAPYFCSAWFFNMTGLMVYSMVVNGLLPAHSLLIAMFPLGIWLEAIILSQALAERIKKTEKAVLDANRLALKNMALYRSVFDNAMEGLYQMNLAGRLLSVNPAMARMLGYSSAEKLLKEGRVAIGQLYVAPERQLQALADTGKLLEETELSDRGGVSLHVLHNAQLVSDDTGNPLHIEGMLIDIGERKKRERAQRDRLRERREREVAKNVTDSKSVFLKNMSYEIRTPLTAIIGFAEAMRVSLLGSQERQHAVASITRNSHHLLQLINDILDFSKIEAGKMSVESIAVDLLPVLQSLTATYQPLARQKSLNFTLECQFPLPRQVLTDPTRFKQILQNLCSNALKYTERGNIKLLVQWDKIQQRLLLAVHDTGMGMSKERLRHLQTATSQLARSQEGIGLGIAITQQLTRLLGGEMAINSVEGQGSQFLVSLACPLPDNVEWITEITPEKSVTPTLQDIPSLQGRVLLAEDNPVNQKLIQRVIAKTGAEVVVVGDGQQAMDAAFEGHFDLILMDVNMPVLGGLEATRGLRAGGYSLPIYALTAEHGQREVDASLSAGCDGHLLKPLELVPFYQVLKKCLNPRAEGAGRSVS